ncbi:MAG TPA: hypothetical protein VMU16_14115 [Candidatus Binataceae bacterium]|nr:hypothetical protein [Candidatus Binataceae bacterium]
MVLSVGSFNKIFRAVLAPFILQLGIALNAGAQPFPPHPADSSTESVEIQSLRVAWGVYLKSWMKIRKGTWLTRVVAAPPALGPFPPPPGTVWQGFVELRMVRAKYRATDDSSGNRFDLADDKGEVRFNCEQERTWTAGGWGPWEDCTAPAVVVHVERKNDEWRYSLSSNWQNTLLPDPSQIPAGIADNPGSE